MDIGLLILRLTVGLLVAGHGAQKLFGWFGGYGVGGTGGFFETMGFRPGHRWALLAGACEFGGGLLTALGLLNPLGPICALAVMVMATARAHWGRPIWVTEGGAELPVVNMAAFLGLALAGPGVFSLDYLLLTTLSAGAAMVIAAVGAIATIVGIAHSSANASGAARPEPDGQQRVSEPVAMASEVEDRHPTNAA
ncbi:MAG: DoxX family protein [Chloroflexi bacterium]|nr:DoxX family protein [Chloroflexota bacterium]